MNVSKSVIAGIGGVMVLGVLAVMGLGFWLQLHPAWMNDHDLSGACTLHGRAAVMGRDQPLVELAGWRADALVIHNDDNARWENLEITVEGLGKYGTDKGTPTGRYHTDFAKETRGVFWLPLDWFENNARDRWNSATMTVDVITVKATLRGEACTGEITPKAVPEP
jgi:hypothetical protein